MFYFITVIFALVASAITYSYLKNISIIKLLRERLRTGKDSDFVWTKENDVLFFLITVVSCIVPVFNIFYFVACISMSSNRGK
jgi:hypothetical protein